MTTYKLKFKIIGCSGWEDGYHPKSIEIQDPFVTGWRSERYCLYPQQLVICINKLSRVRKIQLVSHEYMIGSKIELFTGTPPHSIVTTVDSIEFKRLGSVSLCENTESNFKSREMKSVNVNVQCQYIKLSIHDNHINSLNLYNQVSLVAINFIGTSEKHELLVQTNNATGPNSTQAPTAPAVVSTLDDLSFALSQDPEIGQMIKRIELMKQQAIKNDQFDAVKVLKTTTEELIELGKVLCHHEGMKRQAVEREDYDEAKQWKREKDKQQYIAYKKLNIESIQRGVIPLHHIHQDDTDGLPTIVADGNRTTVADSNRIAVTDSNRTAVAEIAVANRTIDIARDSTDVNKLPSLERKERFMDETAAMQLPTQPEALSAAHINEAGHALQIYGENTVACIYSKQFSLREKGLQEVLGMLDHTAPPCSKSELLRATCQILKRSLSDKVLSCYSISLAILRHILTGHAHQNRLTEGDVVAIMDRVLQPLLSRLGDTNSRIKDITMETLLELASVDQLQALLATYLIKPFAHDKVGGVVKDNSPSRSVPWRYAKGRVELLHRYLHNIDITDMGITLASVMKFVNAALQHINVKVREAAVQVTVLLYNRYGEGVVDLLPVSASDHIAMKNPFWRSLFMQFNDSTGTPAATTVTSKDAKLQQLKGQIDTLKSLVAQDRQVTVNELEQIVAAPHTSQPHPPYPPSHPPSHMPHPPHPMTDLDSDTLDHMCMFCNETREEFKRSDKMEQHYQTECPMLQQCKYCKQVVEIKNLSSHYISSECDNDILKCDQCGDVFTPVQLQHHQKTFNRCTVPPANFSKCTLCRSNVEDTAQGWHHHLMVGQGGCAKNPRRKRRRTKGTVLQPTASTSVAMQ